MQHGFSTFSMPTTEDMRNVARPGKSYLTLLAKYKFSLLEKIAHSQLNMNLVS